MIGLDLYQSVELVHRLDRIVEGEIGKAQVIKEGNVLRIECSRSSKGLNRPGQKAHGTVGTSKSIVGFGEIRAQLDRFIIGLYGVLPIALFRRIQPLCISLLSRVDTRVGRNEEIRRQKE